MYRNKLDGCDGNPGVTKLYLQVTIKYLYGDIIKPPNIYVLDEALCSDENEIICY